MFIVFRNINYYSGYFTYSLKLKKIHNIYLFTLFRSPNTQSVNEYFTLDKKQWNQYNVEWPEYNVVHQPYLRIGMVLKINIKLATVFIETC